jgi:hypothetical protein
MSLAGSAKTAKPGACGVEDPRDRLCAAAQRPMRTPGGDDCPAAGLARAADEFIVEGADWIGGSAQHCGVGGAVGEQVDDDDAASMTAGGEPDAAADRRIIGECIRG